MAPKKAAVSSAKKAAASSHASYQDMIKEAIINLKDRTGSSRQALKKYVQANNNLAGVSDSAFTTQFNRALQRGSETGVFARPKGASGPVKLAGPSKTGTSDSKPAAKTTTKAPPKAKATKKAPAKKVATKPATKKAAPKTSTTSTVKSKANTSKVRKTPAAAPAVEEKAPVVLGKTKSGRVTKSKAPQPEKKAAPKKKAPAKKAKTTPKKA